MSDMQLPINFATETSSTSGAFLRSRPVNRETPYIPVRLRELHTIAMLNTWQTTFVGISAALLSLAAGCAWDLITNWGEMQDGKTTGFVIVAGYLIGSVVFFGFSFVAKNSKQNEIASILSECDEAISSTSRD